MLERSVPDSPYVSFEPGAFTVPPWGDEEQGERGTYFFLAGPSPQKIGEALRAASRTFMYVAEDGRILSDDEVEDGVLRTPDAEYYDILYTPNDPGFVHVDENGAWLSVDTKGMTFGPMVRTMVALIVEELTARQVMARFTGRPGDLP